MLPGIHVSRRTFNSVAAEIGIDLETGEALMNRSGRGVNVKLLRASGSVLVSAFLPALTGEPPAPLAAELDLGRLVDRVLTPDATNLYAEVHREVDRLLLPRVLDYTNGNHRHAARLLGIARQTMRGKLRALGLRVTHNVSPTTTTRTRTPTTTDAAFVPGRSTCGSHGVKPRTIGVVLRVPPEIRRAVPSALMV